MFVTGDLSIWAVATSEIVLAFSPSHDVLHYYGFDLTPSLGFAKVDAGDLWFSYQHLQPDSHQEQSAAPLFLI